MVSGVRTPRDLHELKDVLPDAHAELLEILGELERHYGDMQDTEFTVEEGSPLHAPDAQRQAAGTGRGALRGRRGGGGAARQGRGAIATIEAGRLDALLHPAIARDAEYDVLAEGVAASPGRREGRDRLHGRRRRGGRGGRTAT